MVSTVHSACAQFTSNKNEVLSGENMKLYNYDYSDIMNNLSFSYDTREKTKMTSKVYPTKLEIKVDEETNRPYMYYEGIVQTNKGAMKVTFPKLDLVLDCVSCQTNAEDEIDFLRYRTCHKVNTYKMTTEFNNLIEDSVLYELRLLNAEDCKDIKEYFDERFN